MIGIDDPRLPRTAGLSPYAPPPDYGKPAAEVDAHDLACRDAWAVVVLPDVTLYPVRGWWFVLRPAGPATRRSLLAFRAHAAEHEREEVRRRMYPEPPE